MRINGIGTAYLGFTARDERDRTYATLWFTFVFVPLIPLARHHLQLLPHQGSGFSCAVIDKTGLVLRELLRTVLFSWLLFPLAIFSPLIVSIREVRQSFGIPDSFETPMIAFSIVWLIVWVWKLMDWHEARGHPTKRP